MDTTLLIILAVFAVVSTACIFFNTIVTQKWRDLAPGESKSWKLGFFYYNPLDKRIFLPKRTGLGFTINLARPLGVLFLFVMVVFIVLFLLQVV